jgi:hypothetical protein
VLHAQPHQQTNHLSAQDLGALLSDVAQVCEEVLPHCSPRELSNMAWGFAAAGFYSRRLMQLLLGRARLAALKPRELANLAWAVAKQGHDVPPGWVDEVLLLSGAALAAGQLTPQEATNTGWALAMLQRQCLRASAPSLRHSCARVDEPWRAAFAASLLAQLGACCAADLSQGLWASAVLGLSSSSQQQQQQRWVEQLLDRATQLLWAQDMRARHVATLMWSVSVLDGQQQARAGRSSSSGESTLRSSSSLQAFAAAVASAVPTLLQTEPRPARFAAVLLNACSRLQLQLPADAMSALLAAVCQQLAADLTTHQRASSISGSCSQQQQAEVVLLDVSMLLHGCVRLAYRPAARELNLLVAAAAASSRQLVRAYDAIAAAAAGPGSSTALQQPHGSSTSNSSSSMASAAAAAAAVQQQLPRTRGRELSLLLWSLARLRAAPPAPLLAALKAVVVRQLHLFNAADVGLTLAAVARMRHSPGYSWLAALLQHFVACVDDRPGGVSDVCNAVHALQHLPGGANQLRVLRQRLGAGLMQQLGDAADARLGECGPRELVQLADGFAGLGFRPAGAWLSRHEQAVQELGWGRFSAREQAIVAAAHARLAEMPAETAAPEAAVAAVARLEPMLAGC